MERKGTLIHEDDWGNKVFMAPMRDVASSKVSVDLYVVTPEDKMTELYTIQKQDVYNKKSCFDFLLGLEFGFKRDDVDKIKNGVMDALENGSCMLTAQGKATCEEMHKAVCRYIEDNKEELEDNPEAEVFVRDGYGFILTKRFDAFVKENADLGRKKLEILKHLKVMGALKPSDSRVYDVQVKRKSDSPYFYRIEMVNTEEVDGEVIEL